MRLSYSQLVLGLDRLYFGGDYEAEPQALTVEAYLESNGWNWDDLLKEMAKEQWNN